MGVVDGGRGIEIGGFDVSVEGIGGLLLMAHRRWSRYNGEMGQ